MTRHDGGGPDSSLISPQTFMDMSSLAGKFRDPKTLAVFGISRGARVDYETLCRGKKYSLTAGGFDAIRNQRTTVLRI